MPGRLEIPLPRRNEAAHLAAKIAARSGLELRILEDLVARPQRYAELRRLLQGKGDEILNRALRRMLNDGILDQRSDVSQRPPVDQYELSDLGVRVVFRLAERAALNRLAALLRTDPQGLADAFKA